MTTTTTPTADELRAMNWETFIQAVRTHLNHGEPLDCLIELKLAMAHGAGEQGVRVIDPSPDGDPPYTEKISFENVAALMAQEAADPADRFDPLNCC